MEDRVFVYRDTENEFGVSVFIGDTKDAVKNGFIPVSKEMYEKLLAHRAHWVNGQLQEREITEEELEAERKEVLIEDSLNQMREMQSQLSDTDYVASKLMDIMLTQPENLESEKCKYIGVLGMRQSLRETIRICESNLYELNSERFADYKDSYDKVHENLVEVSTEENPEKVTQQN